VTAAPSTLFAVIFVTHYSCLFSSRSQCHEHSASEPAGKQLQISVLAILLPDSF